MDIISIIMLVLGLIGIIFGFLYGKKRGLCKATVRLVLIGVAALIAFLIRETVVDIVLNTPIEEGKTITDLLTESMASGEDAEKMEGLVNVITNIIKMVLQIFTFILTFIILRISTLILYWIIAAIITAVQRKKVRTEIDTDVEALEQNRKLSKKQRKLVELIKKDQEVLANPEDVSEKQIRKTKKHLAKLEKKLAKKTVKRDRKKWWGSLVGIVQGAIVVICIVAPLSGLVTNVGSLIKSVSQIKMEGEAIIDEETNSILEEYGVYAYPESSVAKVYDVAGGWLYRSISTVKNEDGTTSNIQSQIQAVDGGAQMVDAVTKITEINMEDGFTEEVKDEIVEIFGQLDEIKNGMSQESLVELDRLVKDALGPMLGEVAEELPFDINSISFAEVDFETEGEVVSSFYDLYERLEINDEEMEEEELMEEVVTTLSESTLILPIISQIVDELPEDEKPNLSEEEKATIEDIIDGLENQDNVEDLRKLFGLN